MARLARINIYPVKSLDGQSLEQATVLASGALAHDRRFAIRDRQGEFITAKRTPAVHLLRSKYDPDTNRLDLEVEGTPAVHTFDVDAERRELGRWLSDFFALPVELAEDPLAGYPDDTESPGPTVVSVATLETVAGWFAGLNVAEVRRRFRETWKSTTSNRSGKTGWSPKKASWCGFAWAAPSSSARILASAVRCPRAIATPAKSLANSARSFRATARRRCPRGHRPSVSTTSTDCRPTRAASPAKR